MRTIRYLLPGGSELLAWLAHVCSRGANRRRAASHSKTTVPAATRPSSVRFPLPASSFRLLPSGGGREMTSASPLVRLRFWKLPYDVDAHRAGRAGDGLVGRVDTLTVQVGHLQLGDVLDLLLGDRPDLGL